MCHIGNRLYFQRVACLLVNSIYWFGLRETLIFLRWVPITRKLRAGGTNGQICKACRVAVWKCAQCPGGTLLELCSPWGHDSFTGSALTTKGGTSGPHSGRDRRKKRGARSLVIGCPAPGLTAPSLRSSSKLGCWHFPKSQHCTYTDNGDAVTALVRLCFSIQGRKTVLHWQPGTSSVDVYFWLRAWVLTCRAPCKLVVPSVPRPAANEPERNGREAEVPVRAERQGARLLGGGVDRRGETTQEERRGCCRVPRRLPGRGWCYRVNRESGSEMRQSVQQWPGQRGWIYQWRIP